MDIISNKLIVHRIWYILWPQTSHSPELVVWGFSIEGAYKIFYLAVIWFGLYFSTGGYLDGFGCWAIELLYLFSAIFLSVVSESYLLLFSVSTADILLFLYDYAVFSSIWTYFFVYKVIVATFFFLLWFVVSPGDCLWVPVLFFFLFIFIS